MPCGCGEWVVWCLTMAGCMIVLLVFQECPWGVIACMTLYLFLVFTCKLLMEFSVQYTIFEPLDAYFMVITAVECPNFSQLLFKFLTCLLMNDAVFCLNGINAGLCYFCGLHVC